MGLSKPKAAPQRDVHHLAPSLCPECGYHVTAAGDHAGKRTRPPAKGDFAMCMACGAILQYDAFTALTRCDPADLRTLELEQPTDYRTLRQSQQFVRAQKDWIPVSRRGGRA